VKQALFAYVITIESGPETSQY